MTMRFLIDGDFEKYFHSQNDATALWIFQHVPKTAGSSLRREIASALGELRPDTNIHLDGTDPRIPFHKRLDDAVLAFVGRAKMKSYRFVSGHIFARHMDIIKSSIDNPRAFTFLRSPVDRFISDYRYQRSVMHPDHEDFCTKFPTIELFLSAPWANNQISQYLLPEPIFHRQDAELAVDYLLDNFDFIGLQDRYEASFRTLSTLIGIERNPTVRDRQNPASNENPIPHSNEISETIRRCNQFDQDIYDIISKKISNIEIQLNKWLMKK